jgi:glutathione S-transferase
MNDLPVLYSYRRCPYAMRARMALSYAGISVEIREISLRDKPLAMLKISPKGTVPVLQVGELVIDQSLEIMRWALSQSDKDAWLANLETSLNLIAVNDGPFKQLLDQYKYPDRFPHVEIKDTLDQALDVCLWPLEKRLKDAHYFLGPQKSLADVAIFPFIRQFSMVDPIWFEKSPLEHLKKWLNEQIESDLFLSVMHKYPTWHDQSLEKI